MAISIIKETIELNNARTNAEGNAFLVKRINLKKGKMHKLLQVDTFMDAYTGANHDYELVITPYPAIPTNMYYDYPTQQGRYPSAGDDSVLFKERGLGTFRTSQPTVTGSLPQTRQFPSPEIAAANKSYFYTDHVYINVCFRGPEDTFIENIALSFILVVDDKNVSYIEHTLGLLAESHNAMCAKVMINGHMTTVNKLRGNTFPTWRFGGIRPEHMVVDTFWLQVASTDDEPMAATTTIRGQVGAARQMAAFDEAFGTPKYPDWIKMNLNQGLTSGPIRSDPIPLKYADNGNTRMF